MAIAPGAPDAGFLAYALVDALIGKLVERDILPRGEAVDMLRELAGRLSNEPRALSKSGAQFIRDRMLPEVDVKK